MKKDGFTLVEIIITIAILGTLAAAIFPSASYFIDRYRSEQCYSNQAAIKSLYPSFLENEGLIDSNENFGAFLEFSSHMDCPLNGDYAWNDVIGEASCSVHGEYGTYREIYGKIYEEMTSDFLTMNREEFTAKYGEYRIGGDVLLKYLGTLMGKDGLTEWPEAPEEVKNIIDGINPPVDPKDKVFRELPLFLKDGIVLYYSAKSSEFNQGQWAGSLIYCPLNDSYYYSEERTYNQDYTAHETVLYPGGTNKASQEEYLAWLESPNSGWKKVEK